MLFLVPRPEQLAATVVEKPEKRWWSFETERDDIRVSQHNSLIPLRWAANTDCSPYTGVQAVVNYAAEYCGKSEARTGTYTQMVSYLMFPTGTPYFRSYPS